MYANSSSSSSNSTDRTCITTTHACQPSPLPDTPPPHTHKCRQCLPQRMLPLPQPDPAGCGWRPDQIEAVVAVIHNRLLLLPLLCNNNSLTIVQSDNGLAVGSSTCLPCEENCTPFSPSTVSCSVQTTRLQTCSALLPTSITTDRSPKGSPSACIMPTYVHTILCHQYCSDSLPAP